MGAKPMIPKKSAWPLFPLLVPRAGMIDSAPANLKAEATMKTVERVVRLAIKLAAHYEVPASVFMDLARAAAKAEKGQGGEPYAAALEAVSAAPAPVPALLPSEPPASGTLDLDAMLKGKPKASA
jgi:hypothetical protein